MSKRGLATAILTTLAAQPALAQETALAPVLVEGTVIDPPSMESVPAEALTEAPAADGGEALRGVSGVTGSRLGGAGIDPVIRGQDATQLNVLLDGGYVHGGCPNRMDPPTTYAAPETYDEVSVIKGTQTVLHGGGGSGGTVLFKRDTPRFGPEERIRAEIGGGYRSNADAREVYADVATGNPTGYARLIGSYSKAGNYEDGDGREVRSAYTHGNANLLLGYTPDEHTKLELGAEAFRGEDTLYAGMMDSPESENNAGRLRFEREAPVGFLDGLTVEAYYNDVFHRMDNYSLRPDPMMLMRTPSDSVTYGGRLLGEVFAGDATAWTVGLDYQSDNREAIRYKGMNASSVDAVQSLLWPDTRQEELGIFTQVDHDFGRDDRLRVGLRYDRVTADAGRADEAAASGTSPDDLYTRHYGVTADEQTENNLGGLVRYAHDFRQDLTLFLTLSRTMRTADATERFIAGERTGMMGDWVGNPAIDPERHHQGELNLRWTPGETRVTVSAYYNRVTDYILVDRGAEDPNGNFATIYRNVDATLLGGEITAERRWGAHLITRLTGAYVRGENDTDNTSLPQIPPLEGTFRVAYDHPAFRLGGEIQGVAEQDRVDLASGQDLQETPGYGLVHLFGRVRLWPEAHLRFGVDNLLDKTYATHLNRRDSTSGEALLVNEPGRSYWARLEMPF
ncbi:TonB-dependent copper receptor [Thiohalorhabdus methylotrophus]|uniref:TonB-dependent copper receptor n=1 Tax=Thiohalorhabdus methylotrophus TaxID=3242694 RepID=A0ABV4U123_9GAMM